MLPQDGALSPTRVRPTWFTLTTMGRSSHSRFRMLMWVLPIWSIGEINDEECDTMFRKDGGTIYCLKSGREIDFIRASGVYFVKMQVPKSIAEGFGRHGHA